jgi:hypothetical protein
MLLLSQLFNEVPRMIAKQRESALIKNIDID